MPKAVVEFSSPTVLPVLREACMRAGFASDGAELLRLGENAIYRLAGAPVVVRIARSADRRRRVERELCVARWLASADVPAVRVYDEMQQPLMVHGHPVSFWHAVTGGKPTPTHVNLARLLAAFHGLGECPCELAEFQPLASSEARLTKANGVASSDRHFLTERCADLNERLRDLEFALPPGPIHGDAHTKNLLTDQGRVVLLDFEAVAIGPSDLWSRACGRLCKHSRIKQYLKDGRAMRIETVVNAPRDLGCNARLPNLDELQAKARAANRRILDAERAGQGTVLASPAFERIARPSVDAEGRRTPALRFGDPRVMALAGALCQTLLAATGFTNRNLRVLIAGLLGSAYTPGQMTYDLRRLRLNGLIRRLPHTNRYTLTEDGIRIAVFYTKVYNRLLVPLTAANQPQAPPALRAALSAITRHVDDYATRARLPRTA